MDRLNKLKQYIDFYNKSGMRYQNSGSQNPGFFGGPINLTGTKSEDQINREAADWASQQLAGEARDYRPENSPNFFSNMGGGMSMAQNNQQLQYPSIQQYQSPKINPYSERATQLNNDPYSGQGDQNGIMNYLRRMMGGSGQIGQGQGMTVGIRG